MRDKVEELLQEGLALLAEGLFTLHNNSEDLSIEEESIVEELLERHEEIDSLVNELLYDLG